MIHEDDDTYITRRGVVKMKGQEYLNTQGVKCRRISKEELVKRYPSLWIDTEGHVRCGPKPDGE